MRVNSMSAVPTRTADILKKQSHGRKARGIHYLTNLSYITFPQRPSVAAPPRPLAPAQPAGLRTPGAAGTVGAGSGRTF